MITIKSPQEIETMRQAGKILKRIFDKLRRYISAGLSTQEIDNYAAKLILNENVSAAFKGYKGFPACVCTSINEEVVHGIPSERQIKLGDIISLDLGIGYKGYFVDSAITMPVSEIDSRLEKLVKVTEECLYQGIKQARINKRLGDISSEVQKHAEANGYSVVRQFVGHGIGRNLQEEPEVPNYGEPNQGIDLKEGMVLAIEPMINMGSWEVEILENGWTVRTKDKLPSAHFEHTVAITQKGPEVLT
ncbi:MAG: type I methionyl aminopeptidase [Candidatus Omnitrophica bacterium]|nr:type I methionyl aminopeptidase [Candidatus Omnitrophota bacterium]